MKVKLDFVTNSSSTSFVAWGIWASEEEIRSAVGDEILFKHAGRCGDSIDEAIENCGLMELFDGTLAGTVLEWSCMYGGNVMIGGPLKRIGENQTPKEYKKTIIEDFKKIGFDDIKLVLIEEAWRDG